MMSFTDRNKSGNYTKNCIQNQEHAPNLEEYVILVLRFSLFHKCNVNHNCVQADEKDRPFGSDSSKITDPN